MVESNLIEKEEYEFMHHKFTDVLTTYFTSNLGIVIITYKRGIMSDMSHIHILDKSHPFNLSKFKCGGELNDSKIQKISEARYDYYEKTYGKYHICENRETNIESEVSWLKANIHVAMKEFKGEIGMPEIVFVEGKEGLLASAVFYYRGYRLFTYYDKSKETIKILYESNDNKTERLKVDKIAKLSLELEDGENIRKIAEVIYSIYEKSHPNVKSLESKRPICEKYIKISKIIEELDGEFVRAKKEIDELTKDEGSQIKFYEKDGNRIVNKEFLYRGYKLSIGFSILTEKLIILKEKVKNNDINIPENLIAANDIPKDLIKDIVKEHLNYYHSLDINKEMLSYLKAKEIKSYIDEFIHQVDDIMQYEDDLVNEETGEFTIENDITKMVDKLEIAIDSYVDSDDDLIYNAKIKDLDIEGEGDDILEAISDAKEEAYLKIAKERLKTVTMRSVEEHAKEVAECVVKDIEAIKDKYIHKPIQNDTLSKINAEVQEVRNRYLGISSEFVVAIAEPIYNEEIGELRINASIVPVSDNYPSNNIASSVYEKKQSTNTESQVYDKKTIIAISGSTKFKDYIISLKESLENNCSVICEAPDYFSHAKGENLDPDTCAKLLNVHLAKIDNCELLISLFSYADDEKTEIKIGDGTRYEENYAISKGIKVLRLPVNAEIPFEFNSENLEKILKNIKQDPWHDLYIVEKNGVLGI